MLRDHSHVGYCKAFCEIWKATRMETGFAGESSFLITVNCVLKVSPWPPWPRAQILVWGLEVGIPKTCPIGHEIQHDATRS